LNKLSIITPTFNRKLFLLEIFNVLIEYNSDIFEWIIIDDGSTDNTEDAIKSLICDFPIIYSFQNNSGKHIAVNKGIELASNSYVVILDSDDLPLPNAFKKIISLLDETTNDIVGISVNMSDSLGNVIGRFNRNTFVDTIQNAYLEGKVQGDKWFIWKNEFIKKFKFPLYDNEKFVPEGLLYNRISRNGHKIKFLPEILLNARYQQDGYSNNVYNLKLNNFNGFMNYYIEIICSDNLTFNRYYLKSMVNINMMIMNKSKNKIKLIILFIFSSIVILFTYIFFKKKYYKS
jgi:glycosyltransferase involved in cell wall biosynthesis